MGDPPVRIRISGYSASLTEGEYLVVAVKPSILFRLFPQRAWARSDIALAYTSMNLRGEIKTAGYMWMILYCLLCVCGLGYGYLVSVLSREDAPAKLRLAGRLGIHSVSVRKL